MLIFSLFRSSFFFFFFFLFDSVWLCFGQHANAMKKLLTLYLSRYDATSDQESVHDQKEAGTCDAQIKEDLEEEKRKMCIEHYMFLFLKFISSAVPTIEYDYTMSA